MKILILFTYFIFLVSQVQSENLERFVDSKVQQVIEKCVQWDYSQEQQICTQNIPCDLKTPLVSEPVTVSCKCYIDYSEKHSKYISDPTWSLNRAVFWRGKGTDMDIQKAEEKARLICNNSFKNRLENPEHWTSYVDHCFVVHEYICEDDSIEKSTGRP